MHQTTIHQIYIYRVNMYYFVYHIHRLGVAKEYSPQLSSPCVTTILPVLTETFQSSFNI